MLIVCEQMRQLRKLLDKKNITWEDCSDNFGKKISEVWICRTHFEYKGQKWSVANGFGTYGGFNGANFPAWDESENLGLLELYNGYDDPKGWLTAEEVMKEIEK